MRTSPPSASAAPKTSTGDTPRKDDATGATPPSHERLTTDSSDATGGTPPSYEPLTTNSPQYDIHTLTPLQQRAIDLLAAGYSAVHAADTLGITTRTIRRWKRAQPEFIAEYNRRVAEHSSVVAGHLRHLVDLAVNQVESVFRGRNAKLRTSASLRILSSLVGRHVAHRHGPLTGQEVLAEFVKQRLRAHNENDKQPLTTYFCEDYLFELTNYLGEEALKDQQEQCSE